MDPSPATPDRPAIVLVHGAFADGSCWQDVIPPLERAGYHVTAVQNALGSLADDVATTRRVIEAQPGPVVVVGHSYGGAVMTGAAADNPDVRALVYLAAFVPDAGEPLGALLERYPSDLGPSLRPDAAGFLYIDRGVFHDVFCADVPAERAGVMAATQRPVAGAIFGQSLDAAAWKTIPSWYLVSEEDRAIAPDLQRFYAARMGARTSEIAASHVAFITYPEVVVELVGKAAGTVAGAAAT